MSSSSIHIPTLLAESWLAAAEWHEELGSTQDRARELLTWHDAPRRHESLQNAPRRDESQANSPHRDLASLPFLVGADLQTAGRGRGAHRWWTGPGALALSLVLDPTAMGGPPRLLPQMSLAVGVSLVYALQPHCGDCPPGLHWPNDIYCQLPDGERRKLAGILVDAVSPRCVVIGVGVNTNNTLDDAPPELRGTAVTLRDLSGRMLDHTAWLIAWLAELKAALELLFTCPEELGREFQRHCRQTGETLTLRLGDQRHTGRCRGISPAGELLLDLPEGIKKFSSGTLSGE